MNEYHKIETLFRRELEKPFKLIIGDYRKSEIMFLKDNAWIFKEKIDGTNIRVGWNGHEFEFAGRTKKAVIPKHLEEKLNEIFNNDAMEQIFEQEFGEKEVIIYGEGYGPKIQNGGEYSDNVNFIVFDIKIDGIWLKFTDVVTICANLGLQIVDLICYDTLENVISEKKYIFNSKLAERNDKTKKAEGLVGIPIGDYLDRQGKRIIVKIKAEDFKDE